jgi:hypothetical protein
MEVREGRRHQEQTYRDVRIRCTPHADLGAIYVEE